MDHTQSSAVQCSPAHGVSIAFAYVDPISSMIAILAAEYYAQLMSRYTGLKKYNCKDVKGGDKQALCFCLYLLLCLLYLR